MKAAAPRALLDAGLTDALYGLQVLPGNMNLGAASAMRSSLIGVPACVLFLKTTAPDLLLRASWLARRSPVVTWLLRLKVACA